MQGHGDCVRGVVQDARGAVALVHVAVEDQHPVDPPAGQQVTADHRQVIENAETCRVIVVGVVGAAGQVAGQAVLQGLLGRQQRAAHRAHGAPGQGFAPGQAEAPLVFAGQLAAHVAFDIPRFMGQGQNLGRAEFRAQQLAVLGQAALHQVVAQQAEFIHGEAVVRRELGAVVVVVDQWQRHGDF